jgi:urease accessory protein
MHALSQTDHPPPATVEGAPAGAGGDTAGGEADGEPTGEAAGDTTGEAAGDTTGEGRWEASLDLRFSTERGRTFLSRRWHRGPLQVQRAFYPEGADLCHVYVLHPPGGLVAGDRLTVQARVDGGARALVTTPAAGKVYRTREGRAPAAQRHRLTVEAGGSLEWLPQETILYDGARVELDTRVDLDEGAAFIGWEILCLGRPAAGERFARGACRQRLELWRDGLPLCLERARLDGGAPVLDAPWGLRGAPVSGTLLATPAPPLDLVRSLPSGELTSATVIGDVLVARVLSGSAERAREHFIRLWALLRLALLGRPASAPRIWRT